METTDLPKWAPRGPRPSVRLSRRSLALGFGWGVDGEGAGRALLISLEGLGPGELLGAVHTAGPPTARFSLHSPTPFPGVSALAAGTPGLPLQSCQRERGDGPGVGARGSGGQAGRSGRAGRRAAGRARSGRPRGSRGPRPPRPAPGAASTSGCGRRRGGTRAPAREAPAPGRDHRLLAHSPTGGGRRRRRGGQGRARTWGVGPVTRRRGPPSVRRDLGAFRAPRTARFLTYSHPSSAVYSAIHPASQKGPGGSGRRSSQSRRLTRGNAGG